jgi:hypothetical protein
MPWFFIQLRYMKPFLSAVPNQAAERRGRLGVEVMECLSVQGKEELPHGRSFNHAYQVNNFDVSIYF